MKVKVAAIERIVLKRDYRVDIETDVSSRARFPQSEYLQFRGSSKRSYKSIESSRVDLLVHLHLRLNLYLVDVDVDEKM